MSVPGGVGILGGTFDPIHLGHLRAAEEVREAHALHEMWLVPAAAPPHKDARGLTAAAHRLRMVELAVAGIPAFRASAIELERGGASYSIDAAAPPLPDWITTSVRVSMRCSSGSK